MFVENLTEKQVEKCREFFAYARKNGHLQYRAQLKTNDGFCFMGLILEFLGVGWTQKADGSWKTQSNFEEILLKEMGIKHDTFGVVRFNHFPSLKNKLIWSLNDNGYSFSQLADWMEEELRLSLVAQELECGKVLAGAIHLGKVADTPIGNTTKVRTDSSHIAV